MYTYTFMHAMTVGREVGEREKEDRERARI